MFNSILLIMNCKKYSNKASIQKKTWLQYIPSYLRYYHVIGDELLDTDYRFDHDNHVLYLKVADDYISLPKKVIAAYHAIIQTLDIDYILKTDDDQILLNRRFFDVLHGVIQAKESTVHYGGCIVDIKQSYLSQYHKVHPELPEHLPVFKTRYCSGRFYFLSKDAIQDLLQKHKLIEKEYFEDYAIGYHLDPSYKTNMLHLFTNLFFIDIDKSEYSHLL